LPALTESLLANALADLVMKEVNGQEGNKEE